MAVAWKLAPALETLRKQVNEREPDRSKVSDGTVASTAHSKQNPSSDHEINGSGIVCAWDVTHDLDKKGDDFDAWAFADMLLKNQDTRLKYVISNGRIGSGPEGPQPRVWRKYTGKNSHSHHTHISIHQRAAVWNDARPWNIDLAPGAVIAAKPPEVPPAGITQAMRERMAKTIIDYEAQRDTSGNLRVYTPAAGIFEVAGITSNNHPNDAVNLRNLVNAGKYGEAERYAAQWILNFTKAATGWTTDAGLEFMLRDCVHHRGVKGAAMILQIALGFVGYKTGEVDGEIGQRSRLKMAAETPITLLSKIRSAREHYERNPEPGRTWKRDQTDPKWKGLVNRWDKSLKDAMKFHQEGRQPTGGAIAKNTTAGGIVAATVGTATTVSKKSEEQGGGFDFGLMIPILVVGFSLTLVGWFVWPKNEGKPA